MTLLDHLPSLRRAAAQRISADLWPHGTIVDELGRLCLGGVPITDVAAEFGTPTHLLDEVELRERLHSRHATGDLVPVLAAKSLPTTVMSWVDDEGIGLAIRSGADIAAVRAARADPARMVVHARGLSHDDPGARRVRRAGATRRRLDDGPFLPVRQDFWSATRPGRRTRRGPGSSRG